MPSRSQSCLTGIMSGQRGGGQGRSLVGCFRGEEGDLSSFRWSYFSFPDMLLWTLMCLWWLSSFGVEWHILQSTDITVQMSPMGDVERVKYKEHGQWIQHLGIFPNLASSPLRCKLCHTVQNTERTISFWSPKPLYSLTLSHSKTHNQPFPSFCWCDCHCNSDYPHNFSYFFLLTGKNKNTTAF